MGPRVTTAPDTTVTVDAAYARARRIRDTLEKRALMYSALVAG